jgi:uncharacterized membrane protein
LSYSYISLLHIATAIIAMVTGLLLVLATKGTRRHKQVGYGYVASMVALNLSSLFTYVGLLAAAASEIAVRVSESRFWWAVIVSSAVIIIAGAFLVTHLRSKLLERYGRFQRG